MITKEERNLPSFKVEFQSFLVQASFGTLGRKYAFLIIRIRTIGKHRFNEMLKVNREITRRVLSIRLKEPEKDGMPRALKDVLEEP